jgi:regulator of replication initiation timing
MESPNDDGTYGNYIIDLERRIELLLSENSELKAKLSVISTENEELKKRLMLYENPHTPPSRQMITPKISNPSGKRGAPMGHKGGNKGTGGTG